MTKPTKATKNTLRGLARRLGCSHAALSKQVHDGLLTDGVCLDSRGRVAVTDPEAAARQWNGRRANAQPDFFADLSKQDLLERWSAYEELTLALIAVALDGAGDHATAAIALSERVTARLRDRASDHADPEALADAEDLLQGLVEQVLEDE